MSPIKPLVSDKDWHLKKTFWLIVALFVIVLLLEDSTPAAYVFSYLYIGPILLASTHLSRRTTFTLTVIACILTMLNAWFPIARHVETSTIASRLIATLALVFSQLKIDG